jgi:uncharacterized protein (TIGR03435 family)
MLSMRSGAICACFVSAAVAFAQPAPNKPAFEVASVKPSDPNPSNPLWIGMNADPGMVRYTNITLRDCIRAAYRVRDFQIQGPDWITSARFEITAKLAPGALPDQIPEMLQGLLEERFKLTLRREMKEQSVYLLLVGKDGPKLKAGKMNPANQSLTAVGPDGQPRQALMYRLAPAGINLTAPYASIAALVALMSRFTERPIVDMTGITGQYDFDLTFAAETTGNLPGSAASSSGASTAADPAPSVFDAVQGYGLRLEARKAPIEILVVTHAEKTPVAN